MPTSRALLDPAELVAEPLVGLADLLEPRVDALQVGRDAVAGFGVPYAAREPAELAVKPGLVVVSLKERVLGEQTIGLVRDVPHLADPDAELLVALVQRVHDAKEGPHPIELASQLHGVLADATQQVGLVVEKRPELFDQEVHRTLCHECVRSWKRDINWVVTVYGS